MLLSPLAASPLAGKRLYLRVLAPGDEEELFQAVESSREQLQRRLRWVWEVRSAKEESAFIQKTGALVDQKQAAVWGVFESRSKSLVGVVALEHIATKDAAARLGVWTRSNLVNRGYATEAVKLAVEYGFRKLALHRIYARIDPNNRAMRKVVRKLGFRYEGRLVEDKKINGRWADQECWGLVKTEWRKGA